MDSTRTHGQATNENVWSDKYESFEVFAIWSYQTEIWRKNTKAFEVGYSTKPVVGKGVPYPLINKLPSAGNRAIIQQIIV